MKRSFSHAGIKQKKKAQPIQIDLTKNKPRPEAQAPREKKRREPALRPEEPLQCFVPDDIWCCVADAVDVRDLGAVLAVMQLNTTLALRVALRLKRWLVELLKPLENGTYPNLVYARGSPDHDTLVAFQFMLSKINNRESVARFQKIMYSVALHTSPTDRDCVVPLSNVAELLHLGQLHQELLYEHRGGTMYALARCARRWTLCVDDELGDVFYRTGDKMTFLCLRRHPRIAAVNMPPHGKALKKCEAVLSAATTDPEKRVFYGAMLSKRNGAQRLPVVYALLRPTLKLHGAHANTPVRNAVWKLSPTQAEYTHLLLENTGTTYFICTGNNSEAEKCRILQFDRAVRKYGSLMIMRCFAVLVRCEKRIIEAALAAK